MDENGEGVAVPEEKAGSVEPAKGRTRRPQRAPGPEILVKRANEWFRARRIQAKQEEQDEAAVHYDYGDDDDKEGKEEGNK